MEVNHRNNACRDKTRDLLMSETSIERYGQHCIEPETVFGDIKHNPGFKRFRLGQGEDRVWISGISAQLKEGKQCGHGRIVPRNCKNSGIIWIFKKKLPNIEGFRGI